MRLASLNLTAFIILSALVPVVWADETAPPAPTIELLWPKGAPGAKGDAESDKPTLTVYLPKAELANGTAIVICPGGGYGGLAMDHEGHQVARWLNSFGVAGFILKYRHRGDGYGHPAPLQDVQRAIRTVRGRAPHWGVDSNRVGVLGFSAGGHLASTAGTHFDAGRSDHDDPLERVSSRPDFMILIYPVISFSEPFSHAGSRKNLLGADPDPKLIESLSNEKQVTSETPPTFLVHTDEDRGVPAENSIYFFLALRKAKVPGEMHIYARGEHGFGLGKKGRAVATWPARCADWMKSFGLLERQPEPAPAVPAR